MDGNLWQPTRAAQMRRAQAGGVVLMLAGSSWLALAWVARLLT